MIHLSFSLLVLYYLQKLSVFKTFIIWLDLLTLLCIILYFNFYQSIPNIILSVYKLYQFYASTE